MLINRQEDYASYINSDIQMCSNDLDFSLFGHAYIEFKNEFISYHGKSRFSPNELYYIIEGSGITHTETTEISLVPGKIYCYPSGIAPAYQSIFRPGTKKVSVSFFAKLYSDQDIFHDLKDPICLEDSYHLFPVIKKAILSNNLGELITLSAMVQTTITPLFTQIQDKLSNQLIIGKKYCNLFHYIDKHLYIDLTTEKIAKQTGYSVYALTHNIPKELGFNLKKYITNKIIQSVLHDLTYTDLPLQNLVEKYHFSSSAYFSDWFFKKIGNRPKSYKRIFRQSGDYSLYRSHI